MADLLCLAIKTMRSGAPAVRDRLRDVVVCTHQGSMYGSQPLTRAVECYILHRYEGSATRSRQLRVVSARPGHARLLTLSNCARIPPKPLCIGVAALDRGCGTICQPTYLHTCMYMSSCRSTEVPTIGIRVFCQLYMEISTRPIVCCCYQHHS